MAYSLIRLTSIKLTRLSEKVASRAALRCLLAVWLCLGSGGVPSLGRVCLSEGEVPIEEQESPPDMSAEQLATRVSGLRSSPLPGLAPSACLREGRQVSQPPGMPSGHRLVNGLVAPLRC